MRSAGVRVPRSEAETTRRRLLELGVLRIDLEVAKDGDDVVFPVADSCGPRLPTAPWEFTPRPTRPAAYQDLLPPGLRDAAPRAFDTLGDIVLTKMPAGLSAEDRAAVGQALLRFHGGRAVFWDRGVRDPYRTRDLELVAGTGTSLTRVRENGATLWVDPAAAYYSPRLASERERVARQVHPGERAVDLFGGVAPFGVQLAKAGAFVESIDLNPAATALAQRNVEANGVATRVRLHTGDGRTVAAALQPADRVVMNLPHGARGFLDVAARLARPAATVHYHEILPATAVADRQAAVEAELARLGWPCRVAVARTVRNYSPEEVHAAFDLVGLGQPSPPPARGEAEEAK